MRWLMLLVIVAHGCGGQILAEADDPSVSSDAGANVDGGYDAADELPPPANNNDRDASVDPDEDDVVLDDPPVKVGEGIWISREEILALPTSGDAWDNVKRAADERVESPDLSDQSDPDNVRVMAKALVYVRIGGQHYLDEILEALRVITYNNTEAGSRTLPLGRELGAYIVAADLIDLKNLDPAQDADFRDKLRELRTKELSGKTLVSTQEIRPNNWGTQAGWSRACIAVYLGETEELERTAQVFKGWLGDRESYAEFVYKDLSWQCDPEKPVGINPKGCTKDGHNIDGILPDDQRRCGSFVWPPCKTNYAWSGQQGSIAQAVVLFRQGYDVWEWEDRALLRAVAWLHDTIFEDGNNYPAIGDDTWLPWIINYYYCTDLPAPSPTQPGKNAGWTDWTHARNSACR